MSLQWTDASELNLSESELTPGLQCCLLCGRTLTDRALHDALEEPVLAAIRAEHPEWSGVDGVCEPCVEHYRRLLRERLTREESTRVQTEPRRPNWLSRLFGPASAPMA